LSAPAPILEALDVHAWYGSSHVVHGVDLAIFPGETVGLLGRNGMGKSTLIRSILGLVRERSGRVRVAGRDVAAEQVVEVAESGGLVEVGVAETFDAQRHVGRGLVHGSYDPTACVRSLAVRTPSGGRCGSA